MTGPNSVPAVKLGDESSVSAIGFGAMALTPVYGEVDDSASLATLHRTVDLGVTFIDTANIYGNGNNEKLISKLLADRRDEVTLATKFGITTSNQADRAAGRLTARGDAAYVRQSIDGFVPYSPLGRGFLTGTVRSAADLSSTDVRRNMPRFSEGTLDANLAVVDVVKSVAEQQGATPAQVALAWLRFRADALGVASVPIPGTRRASRVEENLGSLSVTLTPEQLTALDAAGAAASGNRSADLSWVSAGRE